MTEQAVALDEETVELEFMQLREDMTDAVRLVIRKRGGVTRLLYHPVFLACAVSAGVVLVVLGVLDGEAAGVGWGAGLAAWAGAVFLSPGTSAGRMLEANRHHGLIRITVGSGGVRMVGEHSDLRMGWANFGSYAESGRVFVLRSPDRAGNCALVLVKQGVRGERGGERLRELLDRHLARV
ncbi:hypothetical protein ACFUN7_20505 [Streptomyces sp. NPDC057236]|uniref:hypothetical protein n=1 Tax=Streptomyces sp. NPDC057236 TaxID=3346059 RepID=UPI00363D39B2